MFYGFSFKLLTTMNPIKVTLIAGALYVVFSMLLNSNEYLITYQSNEGYEVEIVTEDKLETVIDSLENNQRTIYSVEPY